MLNEFHSGKTNFMLVDGSGGTA
ncbi:MAG: H-X9-DG-CTERM domain-containing protein [Methyloceanibacter sp.]